MVKFLTVTITDGTEKIFPIHDFRVMRGENASQIKINIGPSGAFDVIQLDFSAADPLWFSINVFVDGSMVDVIQKLIIEAMARGTYTDPYFDITNRIPISLTDVSPRTT
tara:strand:+ start:629 stop:955 length:327 start_codon:yes stop_codon:yes gene_type:complete